ncbi:MAG: hypothetical protein IPI35_22525, partial [Deltaproteobacteria bacterium]|nr:hypothetical protein [Deltaproteobacteria bacterium]
LSDVTATGGGSDGAFLEAMSGGRLFGENTFSSNGRRIACTSMGAWTAIVTATPSAVTHDETPPRAVTWSDGERPPQDLTTATASRMVAATRRTTTATVTAPRQATATTHDHGDLPQPPGSLLGVINDCDSVADEGVDGTLEIIGVTDPLNSKSDGVSSLVGWSHR